MTPLVFVHGFMGGSDQWDDQRAAFASPLETIAVDLPGFGANAALEAPTTIAGFAQWVITTLNDWGVEQFHLLGHSMGGMIAQEIATQEPDRVQQLVLYGTGAQGVLPGRFETIEVSKHRAQCDGARKTARRIAATWFLERENAQAFETCAAIAERSSLQAVFSGLDAMQAWSGVSKLETIQAKTLVIWGDQDRTYPWTQTAQLWNTIKDSRLAIMPGCSHAAHLENPALFNQLLRDFV